MESAIPQHLVSRRIQSARMKPDWQPPYPSFVARFAPSVTLRWRIHALLSVNEQAERLGTAPVPQAKLDGLMGDNFARMMGWLP